MTDQRRGAGLWHSPAYSTKYICALPAQSECAPQVLMQEVAHGVCCIAPVLN